MEKTSEKTNIKNIAISKKYFCLKIYDFEIDVHKVPYLHETWNWEGDESILPYKWNKLLKHSNLVTTFGSETMASFIKENYYNNPKFDKKSFFFITHRSEVAGCVYLNTIDKEGTNVPCIEFLLVDKNKYNKKIEEALINLAITRALEITNNGTQNIYFDLSTSNIDQNKLENLKFVKCL